MLDYSFAEDGVETVALKNFTEKAYLDYSMYVILDRALPHIADGLKPVQRRIIYAMSELGLKASAKYKKSARTVGDVLGKYHPHGDMACYEAMVLMAQPFSYRYPLVDGQGNWGAMDDPKSFAAMRYTEAKLSAFSELLLSELGQGTVDWSANFDGTLDEPQLLPAQVPHILLNGITGIAVGMATDIPPHNLHELLQACIHLIEHPKASIEDLLSIVQGPDYPTGGEIISAKQDLMKIYQQGQGSVKVRASYSIEDGEIIVNELPYQTSGGKIIEQIAVQMQNKKLPMVSDIRDESDHEHPIRLVIMPKSNRVDIEQLMSHLFATTDLEKNYRVNMNIIDRSGKPRVFDLRSLLSEWLSYRKDTVVRRLNYRLDKILKRLHVLDALLIAFLNIDEVIHIIRTEDQPKQALIARFDLTEIQAEAILELRLRQLAKLEEIKIKAEQDELQKEREGIERTLSSERRLNTLMKKELLAINENFADDRRSQLVERQVAKAITEVELLSNEPVTIVLSEKGWVRSAKGHNIDAFKLNYKTGDSYFVSAKGRSNQNTVFIDNTGRSYTISSHLLPSARGQGEPLSGIFKTESSVHFRNVLIGDEDDYYLFASNAGYGFVARLGDLQSKNKRGKLFMRLEQDEQLLPPQKIQDCKNNRLAVVSNEGRLLIFNISALPQLAKGKGVKLISIPNARFKEQLENMTASVVLAEGDHLVIHSGKRFLTLKNKDMEHYSGERGRRGNKLPRGLQRVDRLQAENPQANDEESS